ncbi:MlaD family protein [Wenyingzhuangia sp. chi5]|uniref:MlaD family protein n=1 Tax=Wenyingzhuangia gilva TaxID=3057677 RepID=A0ABT8VMZ9_9FLAO|nr:MlaD family protein [Wenyingzhuangia sp. chi5]MDO3693356.1 MlaD family protein [Wenyingzhuangia sp. chi5]
MIKISRELKAGVAALVILALFYWGFSFLKGRNLFNGGLSSYYTTYKNINGLKKSSAVTVNGFTVGKILDIRFSDDPEKKGQLIVEFTIEEDLHFSKKSIAKIYSGGLMGGKSLAIIPSYDGEEAEPGDYLKGEIESDIFSSITNKLNPLQSKVENVIVNIDSVTANLNALLNKQTIENLNTSFENLNVIMASLKNTSASVEVMIESNQQNMNATFSNIKNTTKNLKTFSDSLAQIKILAISEKINRTASHLDSITAGIQAGQGTIGLLAKDENLYNNLEAASKELEELLRDVKEHPKRFVHFSIFGKKERKYEESEETKEN